MSKRPDKRKHPILAAIFFALVPAFLVGLAAWLAFAWWVGLAVGVGIFGFSMDVLLNGTKDDMDGDQ